jgi:hypothetical protein
VDDIDDMMLLLDFLFSDCRNRFTALLFLRCFSVGGGVLQGRSSGVEE